MLRRIQLFLAQLCGYFPSRAQRSLHDAAAFFIFKVWRPAARLIPFFLLRKLPVSSALIGPPKGLSPTTKECCHDSDSYFSLHPPHESFHSSLPAVLGGKVHPKFSDAQSIAWSATSVARIPGARVYGDCGAVITPDDRLIEDVSHEIARSGFHHSVFSRFRLPRPQSLDHLSAVIACPGRANYYHWMFDVLPRLHLLEKAKISLPDIGYFLTGEFGLPFQEESMNALGIPADRCVPCSPSSHFRCHDLLVPSFTGLAGHPPAWACDFLREKFLDSAADASATDRGQKIYISRAGARFRRVLNEEEITRGLVAEGFKIVQLETLTIREQARLFASADVVVSPHGAGCTNIVFCRPGTAFIELFSPRYVQACYWAIAAQQKLRYAYAVDCRNSDLSLSDGHYFAMLEDIEVDFATLLETMELCTSLPRK